MSRTFQITLNSKAYARLERVSAKIDVEPAQFFLFCGLLCLRDICDHKRHITWYHKRFKQLTEDLKL